MFVSLSEGGGVWLVGFFSVVRTASRTLDTVVLTLSSSLLCFFLRRRFSYPVLSVMLFLVVSPFPASSIDVCASSTGLVIIP